MSERWARALLTTYRWAGAAVYPMVGTYVAWRVSRGKEEHSRRRERYGRASRPRPEGPLIWMHAASVGETVAVAPLISRFLSYGVNVVLTTGTVTSARIAREHLGDQVIHQYVPLDLKPAISRFLEHWKPDLAIMAESEIWPMTILELGARRIPQVLVNGRLSDRSFASWTKRLHVAEALLENLAHVVARSDEDAERFMALGARPVTVSGNLKGDTVPLAFDEAALDRYVAEIGGRRVWAAVSTHDGEEALAMQVHAALRRQIPDLLTIIVPRHPERTGSIAAAAAGMGLKVTYRSRDEDITADTDILLGDTIGEMGLYLRLTEIAFVGRSLVGEGGQNPLEPAMMGAAILSGQKVQNFREAYQKLASVGGVRFVANVEELKKAVALLIGNPDERHRMIDAAARAAEEMRGALAKTLQALEPYIHPLIVRARLDAVDARQR